jgi:short-subunit dehydrogenase
VSGKLASAPYVLVTGASGAIGGAIARELRARRPRCRLVLLDRDGAPAERLGQELGGDVRVEVCDLSNLEAIPALLERVGSVDGLVNAAGFMDVRRFDRLPWALLLDLLTVDFIAPLRLFHAAAASMIDRGGGFVVNVTSMAGRIPLKGCAGYGAAKAGLSMASEIAHAELARSGVHVVTVYPGPVASALERGARAQYDGGALSRAIPMGRARPLAQRVVDAIEQGQPRVVYPSLYALGFRAVGLASRAALAFGPDPRA